MVGVKLGRKPRYHNFCRQIFWIAMELWYFWGGIIIVYSGFQLQISTSFSGSAQFLLKQMDSEIWAQVLHNFPLTDGQWDLVATEEDRLGNNV